MLRSTDRLHFLNFEAIPQKVGLEFAFKGGKKNRDVLLMEFTNMRTQPSYCPLSGLYQ